MITVGSGSGGAAQGGGGVVGGGESVGTDSSCGRMANSGSAVKPQKTQSLSVSEEEGANINNMVLGESSTKKRKFLAYRSPFKRQTQRREDGQEASPAPVPPPRAITTAAAEEEVESIREEEGINAVRKHVEIDINNPKEDEGKEQREEEGGGMKYYRGGDGGDGCVDISTERVPIFRPLSAAQSESAPRYTVDLDEEYEEEEEEEEGDEDDEEYYEEVEEEEEEEYIDDETPKSGEEGDSSEGGGGCRGELVPKGLTFTEATGASPALEWGVGADIEGRYEWDPILECFFDKLTSQYSHVIPRSRQGRMAGGNFPPPPPPIRQNVAAAAAAATSEKQKPNQTGQRKS